MVTILDINNQKFSLDGIQYFKIFIPHVIGSKLRIINVYDSRLVLADFANPSQFSVNGTFYNSLDALLEALLPVIFSRGNNTDIIDLTNYYTKTEIDSIIVGVYKYKGSVALFDNLPSSGQIIGDVYDVQEDGANYAWNGTSWDDLGGFLNPVSISQPGIVNNNSLQELGGVDKLINGIRIGRGSGNIGSSTAIGTQALQLNNTGNANTAIGSYTLFANTSGNYNTAAGSNALTANTTGIFNVGMGAFTLWQNTTGSRNTAVGTNALSKNNGNFNTAIGSNAGSSSSAIVTPAVGSLNITIGFQAGRDITSGNNNLLIENITNASITSGNRNIILNPIQKSGVTTGNNNVIIGGFDGAFVPNMSDTIVLGTGNGMIRYISDETGLTRLPVQTNALIEADTTGKAVVTKEYIETIVKPYKVYVALLTQTGNNAPEATVLENTLGGIVAWSRNTHGNYTGTLANAFTLEKTVGFIQSNNPNRSLSFSANTNANSFEISTNGADDILINATIEVRVYN